MRHVKTGLSEADLKIHLQKEYLKRKEHLNKNPWIKTWYYLRQRCNDSGCPQYKYYGAKGIKALITKDELKQLWFRDKANEMNWPSIDRIDNNGNYEFSNCRFVELSTNSSTRPSANKSHCKNGHEYSWENTYIKIHADGYFNRHCRICTQISRDKYFLKMKRVKGKWMKKELTGAVAHGVNNG